MSREQVVGTLTSSIRRFVSGTLFSRVSGLFRDISMAWVFGATAEVAAFMVAFRFSNLLRRLLGEGALQAAFIPLFERLKIEEEKRGARFFWDLVLTLTCVLVAIIAVVELFLSMALQYNFFDPSLTEVLELSRWMFPAILFICLFGLTQAVVQCEDGYFLSGVSPALFNIVWISSLYFLYGHDQKEAMITLSKVVVFAYFVQWIVLVPKAFRATGKQLFSKFALFSFEIREMIRGMGLGVIGVGAVQINAFFDALFARAAELQGPAWLWYALRLEQLPMALFGVAVGSSLLPVLSRAQKNGETEKVEELLRFSNQRVEALLVPCTFAIIALGFSAIGFLFGRGEFDLVDQRETARCLNAYALGLPAQGLLVVASALCWARGDYKSPMLASVASVVLNIVLNALFVFGWGWGAASVAFSTAIAAWVNLCVLTRRMPTFSWQIIAASGIACVMAVAFGNETLLFDGAIFTLSFVLAVFLFNLEGLYRRMV